MFKFMAKKEVEKEVEKVEVCSNCENSGKDCYVCHKGVSESAEL